MAAIHSALGLGDEFVAPGLGGLVDLVLFAAALFVVALSDRERSGLTELMDRRDDRSPPRR